jgi:methionyl aminopeptidase
MITLKSAHEIELMRRAGKITAAARALAGEMVKPGVTTQEIDRAVEHFIRKQGAVPSFLHFPGPPGVRAFPGSVCASGDCGDIQHFAQALSLCALAGAGGA